MIRYLLQPGFEDGCRPRANRKNSINRLIGLCFPNAALQISKYSLADIVVGLREISVEALLLQSAGGTMPSVHQLAIYRTPSELLQTCMIFDIVDPVDSI
jgi:hypothetical protein